MIGLLAPSLHRHVRLLSIVMLLIPDSGSLASAMTRRARSDPTSVRIISRYVMSNSARGLGAVGASSLTTTWTNPGAVASGAPGLEGGVAQPKRISALRH